jgi:hypothetical protein
VKNLRNSGASGTGQLGELGTLPDSLRIRRSPERFQEHNQPQPGRRAVVSPMFGSRLTAAEVVG